MLPLKKTINLGQEKEYVVCAQKTSLCSPVTLAMTLVWSVSDQTAVCRLFTLSSHISEGETGHT